MSYSFVVCPREAGLSGDPAMYRERIYSSWRNVWESEYREINEKLGREHTWNSDAFLRQDVAVGLFEEDSVAASHLYSFFDLSKTFSREHSYITGTLTVEAADTLVEMGIVRFMTFEFMSIAQEYRGGKRSVQIFDLIVSLGIEYFHRQAGRGRHLDAIVTLTRNAKGVHRLAERLGMESVMQMEFNGEPSDLMVYRQPERPRRPQQRIEENIQSLWETRIDFGREA